jgi:hypothetical protein
MEATQYLLGKYDYLLKLPADREKPANPHSRGYGRRISPETVARVLQLHRSGAGTAQIAGAIGISGQAARSIIHGRHRLTKKG